MFSKKIISIDEYRKRNELEYQLSELLDRLDDDLVPDVFDEIFFRELLSKSDQLLENNQILDQNNDL